MPTVSDTRDISPRRANGPVTGVRCIDCTLRRRRLFRPLSGNELAAVQAMKQQHLTVSAGTDVVRSGEPVRICYTLFDGWAARYHQLKSGARQILDVVLPGDAIALDSVLLGAGTHSVHALTLASFCALDGRQLVALLESKPAFAADVLRTQLENERRADARLTMLGRLSGEERVGYFLVETFERLRRRGLTDGTRSAFPMRRTDIADAVGLSKVHAMRALRALRADGLADIGGGHLTIADPAQLAAHVGFVPLPKTRRAIL